MISYHGDNRRLKSDLCRSDSGPIGIAIYHHRLHHAEPVLITGILLLTVYCQTKIHLMTKCMGITTIRLIGILQISLAELLYTIIHQITGIPPTVGFPLYTKSTNPQPNLSKRGHLHHYSEVAELPARLMKDPGYRLLVILDDHIPF